MRKKIELFGLRMKAAVQSHPVEVSLSVLACAMGCSTWYYSICQLFSCLFIP